MEASLFPIRRPALPRFLVLAILAVLVVSLGCANQQPVSSFVPYRRTTPATSARTRPPIVKKDRDWAVPPVRPTVPAPVAQAPSIGGVHRRSEWANAAPIVSRLDPMGTPTCITVHHEGDYASPMSQSYVCGHLRAIRTQQVKDKSSGGLGAGDIAYHFIIEPSGSVWEGRSLQYQGAHAGNSLANRGNIGVCLLGNFDTQPVPEAQKRALQVILLSLMKRYNIPASAVYTHREVKRRFGLAATDCPGRNLQVFMDGLRSQLRVASR
jgi:hypothetical protein